jgi:hypothetical protein
MANCNTLTSILKSCDNNLGGIYNVYINDTDNVTAKTVNLSAHTVTAITASPDYTTFEFKRNVGNFVVSPKIDLNNGSTYFEVTLTLSFTRREAAKSRALQILGEGNRYLDIIVLDANQTSMTKSRKVNSLVSYNMKKLFVTIILHILKQQMVYIIGVNI